MPYKMAACVKYYPHGLFVMLKKFQKYESINRKITGRCVGLEQEPFAGSLFHYMNPLYTNPGRRISCYLHKKKPTMQYHYNILYPLLENTY
jgi:hypothetical protein